MPIIPQEPDRTSEAIKLINAAGDRIGAVVAEEITRCISEVAPINETFWNDPRIGANGAALLQKIGAHIQLIGGIYPDKMNPVLAGAGARLTPNQDGTVTYTPEGE